MKNEEKIVELLVEILAENRETNRRLNHLEEQQTITNEKLVGLDSKVQTFGQRVYEMMDTFFRVLDNKNETDQRFRDLEARIQKLETR